MLTFSWPWMAFLIPLPLISWLLLPANKKAEGESMPELLFPYTDRLSAAFSENYISPPRSKKWFIILLSLLWVFLVLSVMCPVWKHQSPPANRKGYDLMLAVDVSLSMNAIDFSTKEKTLTRLDSTKEVVTNFAQHRQGDRLGLILFAEHAYLQMSMTFDTVSLTQMLNNAMAGMAGPSTAIGDAIGVAIGELRNKEGSRVLILLTDGADTSSSIPPIEAAKIAQKYDIRIYTIGIGSQKSVPYLDAKGKTAMIETDMDEKLLQDIADITGGQYFNAKDAQALQEIYGKINQLEKIDLVIKEYYRSAPLYRYPLGIACLLFLILCLFPLCRSYVL
ncbi:MAG: VWA domain-containing protein [Rickettsiales bacterium]|nr:VWA domain-containing protein [Rickettsiales bacterium]MCA0254575.1 VWA domain-containing protein [Pseudomonadota bacterium]